MKNILVMSALIAAIALSACRREEPEEDSYKLGGPLAMTQTTR